jgi:hypothetical protein
MIRRTFQHIPSIGVRTEQDGAGGSLGDDHARAGEEGNTGGGHGSAR